MLNFTALVGHISLTTLNNYRPPQRIKPRRKSPLPPKKAALGRSRSIPADRNASNADRNANNAARHTSNAGLNPSNAGRAIVNKRGNRTVRAGAARTIDDAGARSEDERDLSERSGRGGE